MEIEVTVECPICTDNFGVPVRVSDGSPTGAIEFEYDVPETCGSCGGKFDEAQYPLVEDRIDAGANRAINELR